MLNQVRHDPRTLALLLLVPALLVGLVAWIFTDTPVFAQIGPAMIALFPFIVMFLVTSIATLRERRSGTLERLLSLPLGKADFILGYALAFGALAIVQTGIAVGFAVWVCGLEVAGNLGLLFAVAIADALLGTSLGLLASAFARSEFQVVQFMPAFVFPQILLGGIFLPRDQLPEVLEKIGDWLPLSHAIDALERRGPQRPGCRLHLAAHRVHRRLDPGRHRRGLDDPAPPHRPERAIPLRARRPVADWIMGRVSTQQTGQEKSPAQQRFRPGSHRAGAGLCPIPAASLPAALAAGGRIGNGSHPGPAGHRQDHAGAAAGGQPGGRAHRGTTHASWSPSRAGSPPGPLPAAWPPWMAAPWAPAWDSRCAGKAPAGPDTLIEFVTPGILLRRLLADPGLESVDAVVIDEVHERGLETDLLLGMLREVHELRGDLVLVAMSATLDAPRFAQLLGDADGSGSAPVIDCPAALHALETRWAPASAPRLTDRGVSRTFLTHVAATAAARACPGAGNRPINRRPGVRARRLGSRRCRRAAPRACAGTPRCWNCTGRSPPRCRTAPSPGANPGEPPASSSPPRWPNPRLRSPGSGWSSTPGWPGNHAAMPPGA